MKITKGRLREIINEEVRRVAEVGTDPKSWDHYQPPESGDPVGPVEAQKMAELLQKLGFTLTRAGLNSFVDFLQGLESQGDLNATPHSRRGAHTEAQDSK